MFVQLISFLLSLPQYQDKDTSLELLKAKIFADVQNLDPSLIGSLAAHPELQAQFFQQVGEVLVFNQQKFNSILYHKEFLTPSFTQYPNRIGLTTNHQQTYLSHTQEVVLTWPFKDCVLESGQAREKKAGKEVFFNQILAHQPISKLLSPKVFTNAKRYSTQGVQENLTHLEPDDNLIIKGNNLLVLTSLVSRFKNKIKCIYIDPPYNTGSDSFNYNDNFNHATWLTFMKNRLEIAKELLAHNGVIFVNLSDKEAHYCKVLMDEIFGERNFVADIIWHSTKSITNLALISNAHTHTLTYFKNKDYYVNNRQEFRIPESGEGFANPDNDPRGPWKADPFQVGGYGPNQQYDIVNPNTGVVYKPAPGNSWKNDYKRFQELMADKRIVFGLDGRAGPLRKRFLYEAKERGRVVNTIWDDVATTTKGTLHLKELFGVSPFKNPKPEQLIKKILELTTNPGDIVLDFFLGSGTTATAAHKMGRRYIGIEQIDDIAQIAIARLEKVIAGEQGGISQELAWQGGGSFVYCELKDHAADLVQQVAQASTKNILTLAKSIFNDYRVKARIEAEKLQKKIEAFATQSFKQQQEFLLSLLEKNELYINYEDLDDEENAISDIDKAFNRDFYQ
ncbi:DNA methyltransferase [Psittacicella hinzii]|uniref:DNA methyltransferase n=1 Tax=Psittacicella hinzii TaxID=2028575 RepID=UPI003622BC71